MAVTNKSVGVKPLRSFVEYHPREYGSLGILIWSETKAAAQEIDLVIKELLPEYGYDVSSPDARTEFQGSYFIRYTFTRKSPELEEDIQLELSDQPPRKELSTEKRGLLSKLKQKLESLNGILIVGALLFANIAALNEMYEKALKAFHVPPPPTLTQELPPGTISVRKLGHPQVTTIQLPPAVGPLMENAEKDPQKFEIVIMFVVANHFESPKPPAHKQGHRRKHAAHGTPPPKQPPPRGNQETL